MTLTPQWFKRRSKTEDHRPRGLPLIHVLEGFLNAGHVAEMSTRVLSQNYVETVHEFDVDTVLDYRARRPPIRFDKDHYHGYEAPQLQITRHRDTHDQEYLLLSGPEPDFGWEQFVAETRDVLIDLEVPLTLGLGGIPMGVPHTRPAVITAHATRPDLVDRRNLWDAEIQIPASAQSLLEFRLGEVGMDAAGYVIHVPHYLAQIEYPTAAVAILDAVSVRLGLSFDVTRLEAFQSETIAQIEEQIEQQGGMDVLSGLEQQYDVFHRGAAASLLADDESLPSGDELAEQLEQFLAQQHKDDNGH